MLYLNIFGDAIVTSKIYIKASRRR